MRCPICNNEFGDESNCKNCGIDKITAFAQYNGYTNPCASSGQHKTDYIHDSERQANTEVRNMTTDVCPFCNEIIPSDAAYCTYCGKKITVTCPNPSCNYEYAAKYPCCPKCGTNREQFLKDKWERDERHRQEEIRRQQEEEKRKRKIEELEKEKEERILKRQHLVNEVHRVFLDHSHYYNDHYKKEKTLVWYWLAFSPVIAFIILMLPLISNFRVSGNVIFGRIFLVSIPISIISLIKINTAIDHGKKKYLEEKMRVEVLNHPEYSAIWASNKKDWIYWNCKINT